MAFASRYGDIGTVRPTSFRCSFTGAELGFVGNARGGSTFARNQVEAAFSYRLKYTLFKEQLFRIPDQNRPAYVKCELPSGLAAPGIPWHLLPIRTRSKRAICCTSLRTRAVP